jgi:hypothetical protein
MLLEWSCLSVRGGLERERGGGQVTSMSRTEKVFFWLVTLLLLSSELCKTGNPSILLGFLSKAGPRWPLL